MTAQPPRTEEQPPLRLGNDGDAGPPAPAVASRSGAARSRRGRATDYRLRGLDLDAPGVAEAPARPERKKHPSRRRRRRRMLVQLVVVLAVTALVAVLLRIFAVQPYSVSSASMVPTLAAGTDVLVVKTRALTGPVKAGDIVVLREPEGSGCSSGGSGSRDVVKRVIGLPGETIWSVRGRIYVNGQRLNEPGWYNPPFGEIGSTEIARTAIPQGSYFVMGDNRTDTCDSRSFGPIPKSLLVGRVVATVARDGHPFVHAI
jgi:signal peptidase I